MTNGRQRVPDGLEVRVAGAADADAVAALYEELHEDEWNGEPPFRIGRASWRAEARDAIDRTAARLLVATAGTGVVGTIRVELGQRPHGPVAEIRRLVVAGAWRGRGVGRVLMTAAEELALGMGAGDVRLTVLTGNAGARRFYERLGYDEFAVRYRRRLP